MMTSRIACAAGGGGRAETPSFYYIYYICVTLCVGYGVMNLCRETGTTVDLWATLVSVAPHHARPPALGGSTTPPSESHPCP